MATTNYINQYLQFLKPERRVPRAQMKQGNIYRIVRYGDDTSRGINARYVFVIGTVVEQGQIKIHCIKINNIKPSFLIDLLRRLRDKSKPITKDYKDLSSLLKSFDRQGKRLFEGYIKNKPAIYSYQLGNYRTYILKKLQYITEVVFEYEELAKLLNEKTDTEEVLKEDRSEND